MEKVTLSSGAVLEITESDILTQHKLFQQVCKEMRAVDVTALTSKKLDLNFIKDLFCIILSSEDLSKLIEPMLRRATYNGAKINDFKFFDNPEAKPDFIEVLKEVARVNLAPFGKAVVSMLKEQGVDLMEKQKTAQK